MYSKEELAIAWFCSTEKLSNKKLYAIFALSGSVFDIKQNLISYKQYIIDITGQEIYTALKLSNTAKNEERFLTELDKTGISFLTYKSRNFPEKLAELEDCPPILYYRGDIGLLNNDSIAIVGTRRATRYGMLVTKQFAKALITGGLTIISGGARGIDTIALTEAIDCSSPSIVVLGCGVDVVYPPENNNLFKKIIETGGLILSEYGCHTPPNSYNFPLRNRIISGLSKGVLVTEAGVKSGTMITVDYALNQGKEVFLVPGNINSLTSAGTNNMLKEGYGNMVTEPDDILSHYKMTQIGSKQNNEIQLDYNQYAILELIRKEGEAHFEQILATVDLSLNELNNLLFEMQMNGLITKLAGNFYGV